MARSVTEIKASITINYMANETIAAYYGFNVGDSFDSVFSKVSFESIVFYIVATAIFIVESLFDILKREINEELDQRLTHDDLWYANAAKAFQYGHDFNKETGLYDEINETSLIVSHSAVTEVNGILNMKIAKNDGDGLGEISNGDAAYPNALAKFESYMSLKKDAGVKINIISGLGDDLKLIYDVFYNPLVLDGEGKLLTASSIEPARVTIKNFIKNLPFNSEFVPTHLTDALQIADGIKIPVLLNCETRYGTNDFDFVDGKVIPYLGYLVITDDNLTINYRPYDAN